MCDAAQGRGKTALMDLFHACLIDGGVASRREHSHRFLAAAALHLAALTPLQVDA